MADRGDTHYHVPALNRWFAFSSLLLLVSAVWMVLDDWARPWKGYQREFRAMEVTRARAELEMPAAKAILAEEERAAGELAQAQQRFDAQQGELGEARKTLRNLKGQAFLATEAEKKEKQGYNWERFVAEEERLHHGDPEAGKAKLEAIEKEMAARAGTKQQADAEVAAQEARIAGLQEELKRAEVGLKNAGKGIELTRKKLDSLAPADLATQVANVVRDFPGIDFIGPNLKVQKTLPPNLTFELNFTQKGRIDMCQTCHVPIDAAGYENAENPFKTHPRLDLFLTAKSPHPQNQFGCTICHRGNGEALDFQRIDHRASDAAEAAQWAEEHHWHKQHYWDYPMLPAKYVEASCVQCHKDSLEVIAPEAPKMAEGYQLFERYGCYACHKVEWFPTQRRPGPSLKGIAQKTTDEFVQSWVRNPKAFRPTTWMPQIFHLENYLPETTVAVSNYGNGRAIMGDEWSDAAVASVAAFVRSRASTETLPEIPLAGDAERGRETFRLVGCVACHNMAPFTDEARQDKADLANRARGENEHGPNLRGVATKVTPEWLYAWIKDPAAYWSETRMPNLRLSDQEAADIVAFVMEDALFREVPTGWAAETVGYKRDVLEEQARWFFNRELRPALQAKFENEWKDDQALLVALGEKFVLGQGCHSCHEIAGLEDAQPIGTELTTWASKTVDKLDFGFVPELLAKHAWAPRYAQEVKDLGEALPIATDELAKAEQEVATANALPNGQEKTKAQESANLARESASEALAVLQTRLRRAEHGLASLHEQTLEFKEYRENFLEQKLAAPRSYDAQKVKNPTERLKMPWFNFTEREIEAITCFVAGLVNDEVQRAKMVPSADDLAMDTGLRALRQKNCAGCHQIEPARIAFKDENGVEREVHGQFLAFDEDKLPPPFEGFHEYVAKYSADVAELEEVIVQLLEPAPGVGQVGDTVVIEDIASIRVTPPHGGGMVEVATDHYMYSDDVTDVDGERRPYGDEVYDKVRWTFAPPVLWNEGGKLQREWFFRFLLDPVALRQQIRTRMPTFHYGEGEAGAIADYFANRSAREWPARYARQLLLASGKDAATLAAEMQAQGLRTSPAVVQGIVDGQAVETATGLAALQRHGDALGFELAGPVNPAYEAVAPRSPTTVGPVLAADPAFFTKVHDLAVKGPNCVQCHFLRGNPPTQGTPIAWAPDLDHVRERLRPDWVRAWLTDPAKIYPGTAMPANFPLDQEQWQEFYPAPSRQQIDAVVTWLFNLDRAGTPSN